jgi:hypothetical protein
MVLGGGMAAAAVGGDDAVVMQLAAAEGEETVITVNCPDQAGLGCDLCRTILEFGLRITRGGTSRPVLPPRFSPSLRDEIQFNQSSHPASSARKSIPCFACDSESW